MKIKFYYSLTLLYLYICGKRVGRGERGSGDGIGILLCSTVMVYGVGLKRHTEIRIQSSLLYFVVLWHTKSLCMEYNI